jgi:hypothetical protein
MLGDGNGVINNTLIDVFRINLLPEDLCIVLYPFLRPCDER